MAGFISYLEETYQEITKEVSWPTWKELQSSATLVLLASAIIALVIFAIDFVFGINGKDSFWQGILGYVYQILSDL